MKIIYNDSIVVILRHWGKYYWRFVGGTSITPLIIEDGQRD